MLAWRAPTLLLLLVVTPGCDAFYQVHGRVRSCADQKPIAGARVRLTYPGERGSSTTDAAGSFRVAVNDLPGDNPATLTAEAPGYRAAERTVHHSYEESQDICLPPTDADR